MFLKKKYRVTTRGKIVFLLVALLMIYGIYSTVLKSTVVDEMATPKLEQENSQITETQESNAKVEDTIMIEASDSTKIENCTTNELKEDKETLELRLIEAVGFTIYYQANNYYVPESNLPLLSEFAAVALKFTDEQIVIEGNTNTVIGLEADLDTENSEQLGYTRALVIKNYLIKRGVSKDRIIIYNNKDDKSLNIDQSAESIALNRRVDVFFSQFGYNEIKNK